MKLVSFQHNNKTQLGAINDERIVVFSRHSNAELPATMLAFLQSGEKAMVAARQLVDSVEGDIALDEVKLMAPISNPSKVIAIGLNYMDHVRESGLAMPDLATMFCKYPSAIVGTGDAIHWSTQLTEQVDYEAELAVVIGKMARNVSETDAYQHIAGYMNCNDVSARDLQLRSGDQWLRGKCLDSFCPLGPWLVTADDIPDPHRLTIQCRVNNTLMQDSNTAEMIYKIPYLIKYLSEAFTLLPGDVIITGTPNGVGAFRKPPVWLNNGDRVSVQIEGLGCLQNHCISTD